MMSEESRLALVGLLLMISGFLSLFITLETSNPLWFVASFLCFGIGLWLHKNNDKVAEGIRFENTYLH